MNAADDFELISNALQSSLAQSDETYDYITRQLETSAATPLINSLRAVRFKRMILAIGGMAVFESVLQLTLGWQDTLADLDNHLRANFHVDLADRFLNYRDAINVLKHGKGRSHERLLRKRSLLKFKVRDQTQAYGIEGDVSEVASLVLVDREFVIQCTDLIDEIVAVLRQTTHVPELSV